MSLCGSSSSSWCFSPYLSFSHSLYLSFSLVSLSRCSLLNGHSILRPPLFPLLCLQELSVSLSLSLSLSLSISLCLSPCLRLSLSLALSLFVSVSLPVSLSLSATLCVRRTLAQSNYNLLSRGRFSVCRDYTCSVCEQVSRQSNQRSRLGSEIPQFSSVDQLQLHLSVVHPGIYSCRCTVNTQV